MITLEYKDTTFDIKSDIRELTLSEFEQISNAFNKENEVNDDADKQLINNMIGYYGMWYEVFDILGVPEELSDGLTEDEFWSIVKSLTIMPDFKEEYNITITINNEEFTCSKDGTPFVLKMGQLKRIQSNMILHKLEHMSYIIAEIFHNEKYTFEEKVIIVKDAAITDVLPYIQLVNSKMLENIRKMINV